MKFASNFLKGINCYFKANHVIKTHKLWLYITLPGMMSLLYFVIVFYSGSIYSTDMANYFITNVLPGFLNFGSVILYITKIFIWILLFLLAFFTFKFVVMILFAPFLAFLSEVVEKKVYNSDPPDFKFSHIIKDIIRGLVISLRNIGRMLLFTFLAWILVFIPVVGVIISPVLIILIQAYYEGFSLADYTLERKRYSVKESVKFARNNRGTTTGVGTGFMLFLLVPVIGWFAAPGYGTIAATLAALDNIKEIENQ